MKKFTFPLFVLLLVVVNLNAQKGWEAGGWIGGSHYFGDLNTNFRLSNPGLAGGLIARYNFDDRICLKFSGNIAQVSADDADSNNQFERARNLSFRSLIYEGAAQLEFNFLPYVHGSNDEYYTPYLFGGFSVTNFNPEAQLDGTWYELRPLGTEGQFRGEEYYSVTGAFAFGGGFKIDLSYELSLNFEIAGRYLFSDYLDDVSKTYPDKDDLEGLRGPLAVEFSDRSLLIPGVNDGEIGAEGRQRGSNQSNDSYYMIGVGIVYYFGDLKCPPYAR